MPDYEAALFDPPAPAARVVLRNPDAGTTVSDVLLLLLRTCHSFMVYEHRPLPDPRSRLLPGASPESRRLTWLIQFSDITLVQAGRSYYRVFPGPGFRRAERPPGPKAATPPDPSDHPVCPVADGRSRDPRPFQRGVNHPVPSRREGPDTGARFRGAWMRAGYPAAGGRPGARPQQPGGYFRRHALG